MKKTILMMLLAVIVMGLAFGVSGCAKKSVDMEDEMATATVEDTAPKPGEPGYEKIYEESMAAKEESLEAQAAMDKKQEFLEGRTSAPLLPIYFDFDKSNIRLDQRSR
ncbi:MAG: peptidoglycan-associated lipoprotein, partial [Desulfobulbales bacterium]|nr:peptidoglycan-associated lipoprotein [Desulfobulbales bacterium]